MKLDKWDWTCSCGLLSQQDSFKGVWRFMHSWCHLSFIETQVDKWAWTPGHSHLLFHFLHSFPCNLCLINIIHRNLFIILLTNGRDLEMKWKRKSFVAAGKTWLMKMKKKWRSLNNINCRWVLSCSCFPPLIVVPLSSHEVDGVRKEKERLTAAINEWMGLPVNNDLLFVEARLQERP